MTSYVHSYLAELFLKCEMFQSKGIERIKTNILCSYFDVLLTVHYSNDQFWFQLMHHNFTLLTKSLYMFRAPTCPSSGGQTTHTPQLVQLHLL